VVNNVITAGRAVWVDVDGYAFADNNGVFSNVAQAVIGDIVITDNTVYEPFEEYSEGVVVSLNAIAFARTASSTGMFNVDI